jgi:hypothetical protein
MPCSSLWKSVDKPLPGQSKKNSLLAVSIKDEAVRFSLSELIDSAPHVLTPSEVTVRAIELLRQQCRDEQANIQNFGCTALSTLAIWG